nr:hypothetical protein [Rhizobium leguminosarum]
MVTDILQLDRGVCVDRCLDPDMGLCRRFDACDKPLYRGHQFTIMFENKEGRPLSNTINPPFGVHFRYQREWSSHFGIDPECRMVDKPARLPCMGLTVYRGGHGDPFDTFCALEDVNRKTRFKKRRPLLRPRDNGKDLPRFRPAKDGV